jgi:two-component system phosphate regulon sensor histidine kinase PhoR
VLVFHDVTDLRRLERMRQDFVANVSHELKTPLASIKAYTETLLDWALHDENVNVKFLHRIEEQADRLNQLILDLLSLARLESGLESFEHRPLALSPLVSACVEAHRDRAEAKSQSLGLDLGPLDDATLVLADDEAVRQILDNLISNAIKYTPEKGSVTVRCASADGDGYVEIEVADTGIGIPRDDLPRVFERFYRVDKARSRQLGGTGLGLSIVKHLVQSLGGQVTVDSRVGVGTRFTVQIPRYCPRTDAGSAARSPLDRSRS